MRFAFAALFAAAAFAAPAAGADTVVVGPQPGWVVPVETPAARKADGALDVRLLDLQVRIDADGLHQHLHQVVKILAPQGLAAVGSFAVAWQPGLSTARVQSVVIHRDGKTIDALGDGRAMQVLRREMNLEARATLDGALTAVLAVPDLRVGDELETRWTLDFANPVLGGRSEFRQLLTRGIPLDRLAMRFSWPDARPVAFRVGDALPKPALIHAGGTTGFGIAASDYSFPRLVESAPLRFAAANTIALSEFRNWGDVAATMQPLFDAAATATPKGGVAAEIARIAAITGDPVKRADEALRTVERQIRYFARVDGLGGYQPATADAVWAARSGDCKGKTVLLLALLRGLGIDAEAALVSSGNGDGLDRALPMPSWFDHVVVRARIAGHGYWLDGTRLGDNGIGDAVVPDFRWALPLKAGSVALVPVVATALIQPDEDWRLDLDARAGLDKPARATGTGILRGDKAIELRTMASFLSPADRDTVLRKIWAERHDWLTIDSVTYAADDATGTVRLGMTGSGTMDWHRDGSATGNRYEANKARLGQTLAPKRNIDDPKLPVTVAPVFSATRQTILLPNDGHGFSIEGDTFDTTIGGIRYRRTAMLANGRFDMTASSEARGGEVAYDDAVAADARIDKLYARQLFIRMPQIAPRRAKLARIRGGYTPAQHLSGSVSSDDYPEEALRSSAEGTTVASLDIDVEGRVTACRTAQSSGSKILDDRTCDLIKGRFVYAPARAKDGRAVPETRTQTMKWQIPGHAEAVVFKPWDYSVSFVVEKDGTISGCKMAGAMPSVVDKTDPCAKVPGIPPLLGADGKPYRARVTMRASQSIEPADAPPGPAAKP